MSILGIHRVDSLARDDGRERVVGTDADADHDPPPEEPGIYVHTAMVSAGTHDDAEGGGDEQDQLGPVHLFPAVSVRHESKRDLAEKCTGEGRNVDAGQAK